jgi:hypothetical protein
VHSFTAVFASLSKLSKYAGEKPYPSTKQAYDDFSSSHFNVQGHILSTSWDALKGTKSSKFSLKR